MKKALISYMIALLLFGSNGVVASHISMNSYEIVLSRTLIGSIFLMTIFMLGKNKLQLLKHKKQGIYLLISGAAMGASWMFLYEAYHQIGVSVATLAYYCGPVIVMVLAPFVFGEKVTSEKAIGFVLVIAGMIFVNRASLLSSGVTWGLICGILSALMYALMVICNKKAKDITGLENTMCQLMVSFLVVAIFTLFVQNQMIQISKANMMPILFLGVVNTGIGCYLYFSSIQKLSAQSISVLGYLEPLSALLFSAVFLKEQLTIVQMVGAALILGGVTFSEKVKFSRQTMQKQY